MDLHVGIDDITKKSSNLFWGGGVLCNNQNGGLSIANEISFFLYIQIYSIFPPAYGLGGKCQRTKSCY